MMAIASGTWCSGGGEEGGECSRTFRRNGEIVRGG